MRDDQSVLKAFSAVFFSNLIFRDEQERKCCHKSITVRLYVARWLFQEFTSARIAAKVISLPLVLSPRRLVGNTDVQACEVVMVFADLADGGRPGQRSLVLGVRSAATEQSNRADAEEKKELSHNFATRLLI